MKYIHLIILYLVFTQLGFSQKKEFTAQDLDKLPPAPDYSAFSYWAAHPNTVDAADLVPGKPGQLSQNQENALVDVFFVHPTIYTGEQNSEHPWNANLADSLLNKKVDDGTIKNQAGIFNESARVYAPRYRQAHLNVFYTADKNLKQTALDYAYEDVRSAFAYYLQHWNNGRQIIIASHSQGTLHAARLLEDFFLGEKLQHSLVVAYLIGMPIKADQFAELPPCEDALQTECWISWNTFRKGHYPESFAITYDNALSTNPLNWTIGDTYASREENQGGVLRKFEKIVPRVNDAQNYKGVLWVEKPHFPGRIFLRTKRYHIADYNLFYMNIRSNVKDRVGQLLIGMDTNDN